MRAYYATYNEKVYQLMNNDMVPTNIMNMITHTHSEVSHMKDRRAVNVKLTISNVDSSAPSNKEVFDSIISKLKTDKTTKIEKLSDVYRIYIEYSLVDDVTGNVVDEGVGINELRPNTFILPLGITTENEFVSRLGISLSSKIEKAYRDVRPFGVMNSPSNSRFTLYIKRIYVLQLTMDVFSITECTKRPNPVPYVNELLRKDHHQPHWNCTAHGHGEPVCNTNHPSIPTMGVHQTLNINDSNYIMMYDTLEEGVIFDPVTIDYKPTSIAINVYFTFLDVLLAAQEEIDTVLEENKKDEEVVIPPVSEGDGMENDNQITNGDKGDSEENLELPNPDDGVDVSEGSSDTNEDDASDDPLEDTDVE